MNRPGQRRDLDQGESIPPAVFSRLVEATIRRDDRPQSKKCLQQGVREGLKRLLAAAEEAVKKKDHRGLYEKQLFLSMKGREGSGTYGQLKNWGNKVRTALIRTVLAVRNPSWGYPQLRVPKQGAHVEVYWRRRWPASVPDRRWRNDTVVWIFGRSLGSFGQQAFIGGDAMASQFNTRLLVTPRPEDINDLTSLEGLIKSKHRRTRAERTGLLFHHCHELLPKTVRALEQRGYHVVTAGHPDSVVSIDNRKIGSKLGEELIAAHTTGVLAPELIGIMDPNEQALAMIVEERISGLVEATERRMKTQRGGPAARRVSLTNQRCRYSGHGAGVIAEAEEKTVELLAGSWDRVRYIFAPTGELGEGALRAVRRVNRPVQVFAGDVTVPLFLAMQKPGSPLSAMCGLDPYHVGRYLVRLAAHRPAPPGSLQTTRIQPVLVTANEITKHEVTSFLDLARSHPDLRFDTADRCWPEWMRYFCRSSYGPVRHAKVREQS